MKAVRNGGRLATITSDPPAAERGITVRAVQVVPDGRQLGDQARRGSYRTVIVLRHRSGPAFRPRREQPTPQARPVGRDQPAPDAVLANVPVQ